MGEHHPALSPEAAQALAEQVALSMYERDTASQALGLRILRVAPGHAELTMTVRADMLNGHEICHGGFIFTLADSAFAFACNSFNRVTVAQGASIDFLRPATRGDRLRAEAKVVNQGSRTGVYDVEVRREDGKLIACFRGNSFSSDTALVGAGEERGK